MDTSLFANVLVTTIAIAWFVYSAYIFRLNSENIELKTVTSFMGGAVLSII